MGEMKEKEQIGKKNFIERHQVLLECEEEWIKHIARHTSTTHTVSRVPYWEVECISRLRKTQQMKAPPSREALSGRPITFWGSVESTQYRQAFCGERGNIQEDRRGAAPFRCLTLNSFRTGRSDRNSLGVLQTKPHQRGLPPCMVR